MRFIIQYIRVVCIKPLYTNSVAYHGKIRPSSYYKFTNSLLVTINGINNGLFCSELVACGTTTRVPVSINGLTSSKDAIIMRFTHYPDKINLAYMEIKHGHKTVVYFDSEDQPSIYRMEINLNEYKFITYTETNHVPNDLWYTHNNNNISIRRRYKIVSVCNDIQCKKTHSQYYMTYMEYRSDKSAEEYITEHYEQLYDNTYMLVKSITTKNIRIDEFYSSVVEPNLDKRSLKLLKYKMRDRRNGLTRVTMLYYNTLITKYYDFDFAKVKVASMVRFSSLAT